MVQDLICSLPEIGYITNVMNVYPDALCAAEMVRRHCRLDITGERYLADGVQVNGGSPNEGVALWQRWLNEDRYDLRYVEQRRETFGEPSVARLCDDIRRVLWCFEKPGFARFFCKNPCLTPHVALLAELFPDAKFLHIVRDPRHCANSMVKLYRLTQQQLERIRACGRHGVYDTQPYMPFPRFPKLAEYVNSFGAGRHSHNRLAVARRRQLAARGPSAARRVFGSSLRGHPHRPGPADAAHPEVLRTRHSAWRNRVHPQAAGRRTFASLQRV